MRFIERESGLKKVLRSFDSFIAINLALAVAFFTLFLILPVLSSAVEAFLDKGAISLRPIIEVLTNPEYVRLPPSLEVVRVEPVYGIVNGSVVPLGYIVSIGRYGPDFGKLVNSLFVSFTTAAIATVLGVIAAFVMSRYRFPGKSVFGVLLIVPLLATPFVNGYVIGRVFGRDGLINMFVREVLGFRNVTIELVGLPAVILVQSLSFFPIVYLNAYASMINLDPSLEEQAENLGSSGLRLFRTITFPLSLPGVAAGAALVFIFSLEDLGAPIGVKAAFGLGLHNKLLSYDVYDHFRKAYALELVSRSAYAVTFLMLLISSVGFILIRSYVSLRQYAMLSKGGRWAPRVRSVKGWRKVAVPLGLAIILAITSFPQIGTVLMAFSDWAITGTAPRNFRIEYFLTIASDADIVRAIGNSVRYSLMALAVMVLVGGGLAYITSRRRVPGSGVLDLLATLPIAIPGIVIGVGYMTFFNTYFRGTILSPVDYPTNLLVFTYSARRIPFVVRPIYAGLQQVHVSLEEAAHNLGASRNRVYLTVILPLIIGNVVAGALTAFVYSMNEVSTSLLLGARDPERAPLTYWISDRIGGQTLGAVSAAAAACVLLMILQLASIAISNTILRQRVSFLGV
ncbi:MAG: iron ABC transporter permease [Sulfolobales archaeon]